MPVATAFVSPPLGHSIPYLTPHAVSVSLPTWEDNVAYEEGDKRVVDAMQTGYPRFFVHRSIQKLAAIANEKLANNTATDKCYLFPTLQVACSCISFLESRQDPSIHQEPYYKRFTVSNPEDPRDNVTLYAVFMHQDDFGLGKQFWQHAGDGISSRLAYHCLHLLGESIPGAPSSTPAPHLANGNTNSNGTSYRSTPPPPIRGFSRNKHYSKKSSAAMEAILASSSSSSQPYASTSAHAGTSSSDYHNGNGFSVDPAETSAQYATGEDTSTYIEERYARNLTESQAPLAKIALRRRIAGVLKESSTSSPQNSPSTPHSSLEDQQLDPTLSKALQEASSADAALQPSSRGVKGLTEDDVYLYPGGMSAIFHAFMTVLTTEQKKDKAKGKQQETQEEAQDHIGKSICFGFPYTDTLKILQKWGPGCEFFGRGLDSDLEELEALLQERQRRYESNPNSKDPNDKPILSLFAEFPSNPLLRAPDLERLKQLADKYGFYIVIDETVGGFVNVETLPFADIVVSSLTKIFSGDSNVMGGSLTLNPSSKHYAELKHTLNETYEDTYYSSDAIFMERNSRDFRSRVNKINQNTEQLCDFLRQYTVTVEDEAGSPLLQGKKPVLTGVFYPKFITPKNYEARMRHCPPSLSNGTAAPKNGATNGEHQLQLQQQEDVKPGYGSLFSLTFTNIEASKAFFDALKCCKGPSLGTNFTLACPYTVLAHYLELDWAKTWEVEEGLVRVSIGLEDRQTLLEWFTLALMAAETAGMKVLESSA